jgi:hypothetical protein
LYASWDFDGDIVNSVKQSLFDFEVFLQISCFNKGYGFSFMLSIKSLNK